MLLAYFCIFILLMFDIINFNHLKFGNIKAMKKHWKIM